MVSDGALVKFMQQTPGKNPFRWPHKDNIMVYDKNKILSRINKTIAPTNNRGDYKIHASDYDLANEMMKHSTEKQSHIDFNN